MNIPTKRSSSRCHHSPPLYQEEQASIRFYAKELLELSRALKASQIPDVDDENDLDTMLIDESSTEEEKDEKKESDDGWTTEANDVNIQPFIAPTGKQHEARHATSPVEFLQLFLPYSLMQQLAEYTNSYAHYRGEHYTWRTTTDELYAFIGAHIFMGIVRLPAWHMYWSESYQQPLISSLFTRDRFGQLLRYFRVAPHTQLSQTTNPLSDFRPLVDSLQLSFPRMYLPSRYLALDEAMVAFKGRWSIKQYIPSKPHKWGYKIYCLSSDDYFLHFEVYEGRRMLPHLWVQPMIW